ncbi:hypothetical protein MBSD_n1738 [Mizugakiibacter sediminis]|uniref:Uncharacterized protein n=1 Tax=Mizugakiibacter sediminis TaxID=1475481 RepID=A0A0K8QNE4_9GAMM|nr:PQQ-binding-like beta-propeller repeat protein [Mizugakiibacter sediminis]GAP66430.1 hypothetical protein MBSD_n1738 [Mizugakiibacter sediminis]
MPHARRIRAGRASAVFLFLALTAASAAAAPPAPALVAPGVVDTGDDEAAPALSPDGQTLYFVRSTPDFLRWTVLVSRRTPDGGWSAPQVAWFSGRYADADVSFSPDGRRMFFVSTRPTAPGGAERPDTEIWTMTRTADGWSAPRHVAELESPGNEWFPVAAADGTLYFGSERRDGNLGPDGTADLYRARWLGDHYAEPENLGPPINTAGEDIEGWIAPDQSYLIFSSKGHGGEGAYDLWVSYRCEGAWTTPRNLGAPVNSYAWEFGAKLSPDGRYLYFASNRGYGHEPLPRALDIAALNARLHAPGNGLRDIYRVETAALALHSPCAARR